jgi:hypothetical protein
VPPRKIAWPLQSSVNVYISNYWTANGAGYNAICAGISSWAAFNLNNYTCLSAAVPPAQSYAGNYIWVSYDPTEVVSGFPHSDTLPCGYWDTHGYGGGGECPPHSGADLKHPWMKLGPYADDELQGVGAHEEGHDNWLADCYNCQYGGSVMGRQQTWSSAQPTAPTDCDIAWAAIYRAL